MNREVVHAGIGLSSDMSEWRLLFKSPCNGTRNRYLR